MSHVRDFEGNAFKNIILEKRGEGLGLNRLSRKSPESHRARNSQVF